jgi:hypothetical protein
LSWNKELSLEVKPLSSDTNGSQLRRYIAIGKEGKTEQAEEMGFEPR